MLRTALTGLIRTKTHRRRAFTTKSMARHSTSGNANVLRRALYLELLEDRRVLSTFSVLNTADNGAGSLRQAMVDANANIGADIIQFASSVAGTISLTSGELAITDEVDLQGPGAEVVTISGNNTSRIFYASANATISGLTIANGSATNGGGIFIASAEVTIRNSTLSGNTTTGGGGGIFNAGGTLTVDNSTLEGNSAPSYGGSGGGIFNSYGSLFVIGSSLIGNSAGSATNVNGGGGGIYNAFGTLTVDNSLLSGNFASYYGGGINNRSGNAAVSNTTFSGNSTNLYGGGILNSGTLTVDGSTFSGNSASAYGGGINNDYGALTVRDSTLSANSAGLSGGGLYVRGTAAVERSTLSDNTAPISGGAIATREAVTLLTVLNSTLSGNTSSIGGGVINEGSTLSVVSSTLSGNVAYYANSGGGIKNSSGTITLDNSIVAANFGADDINGAIASSSSHNLIGVDTDLSGISHGSNGNQIGTASVPINPMLGALQSNGGPTATMALLPGSPAINAGNNSLIPVGVTTDQRGTGFARIDSGTGIVDIGAFELLNRPPVANAGGPYSIAEGGSLSLDASGSYDPDPLDTLTYSWDVNGDGIFGDASGVNPMLTWAQLQAIGINDGPRSVLNVRVRVDDAHAHVVDSPATTLTVTNVSPTLGTIVAPVDPVAVTTVISASAAFSDAGTSDTHTAIWNWGDGSTSAGAVTETNGFGSASGSHAYTAAGVYTVTLTVTDDDSGSSTSTFQYVVAYDPAAGFVTGGGWINSPAGAYTANPGLEGKANFGFNSKYQKGATIPTGNTEFQFKVADFNFKSTSYEWLVISGAKARYRGVGTVNGTGSYGFELTAWDGQVNGGGGVDKFRIKVWNKNQGNGVVYDNMPGASDGDTPTTALGGGSIVIHKEGQSLLAAGGASIGSGSGSVTQETLNAAVDQAINYWVGAGIDANIVSNLRQIHVQVAELPGAQLGLASDTDYIWIDRDAAGYGWRSDASPAGMDLMSVVAHELGHKLGLQHSHADDDLMAPALQAGAGALVGAARPMAFPVDSSVFPASSDADGARPGIRVDLGIVNENSDATRAHDEVFASLADPTVPSPRKLFKSPSVAKQLVEPEVEQLLSEDLLKVIASAHLR